MRARGWPFYMSYEERNSGNIILTYNAMVNGIETKVRLCQRVAPAPL